MRLWSRPLIVAGMGVVPQGPEEGPAAVPAGGGRAWPGFETTRRAQLAARTASGRAAAHRHTQRPGPPAHGTPVAPDNGYDSETSPRGSRKDRPR